MPIHLHELASEVVPDGEAPVGLPDPRSDWQELARLAQRAQRLAEDRRRTAAEGFDD
ncbi:MAG: hypothetical protein IT580_07895 [Verrucomicrobiales bacterium]|nr:hypothetical protein [Verrucomicrobiales bacterium]